MKIKGLRIIPLGGLGEVGRNMMVYEYDGEIMIVDTGIMFPENDMIGIDYIIPDLSYISQRRDKVRGIVITHGHEDHTGAIRHVLEEVQAPIYATALTIGMLEAKLARQGMAKGADLHTVDAGQTVKIGPFDVKFFHVSHSIPDGVGLGIHTPAGLVVHTSDYKFDHTPVDNWPTDYAALAAFAEHGVLALLADSTNADRPGWTPSERVIDQALDQVFRDAPGRIIVASFASLISRMQQVAEAAERYNRKIALVGTSMQDNYKIASRLGYIDIPDAMVVPIDQAVNLPENKVVILCTGAQGEPTSILGRLSNGTNRMFDIKQGDTVVLSSHPIPGNEENVYRTINRLFERGANVIYEQIAPVHVSGHASQEEMKMMLHLTRPQYFIPIHGELRHLKQHALIAEQLGVPRQNIAIGSNGQVIEFREGRMFMAERVPSSYVFVDGSGVGDVDPAIMKEREMLARDGIVLVHLDMDRQNGKLRSSPEILTRGFIMNREAEQILAQASQQIVETVARANGNLQRDVEKAVGDSLYRETRRRPMVFVTVSRS